MPILDLQRRLRQAGRIRIGDRGGRNGAPRKLVTFRLTSTDRSLLDQAAALYGGDVEQWEDQWQVTTTRDALDVVVPPTEMAFSQWYEAWSGGGCLRRCDGQWDMLNDKACQCNPESRDCDAHTRLSVMLRDLPGVGTWRIDTQGFYAASELLATVELIQQAAARGAMLPARLLLDRRTVKRDGKTLKFVVPVLDLDMNVLPALAGGGGAALALGATAPSLTPVPPSLEPGPTVAEQTAPPAPKKSRANAAAPIKGTGKSRRKEPDAAEASGVEGSGSVIPLADPAPPTEPAPAPESGRTQVVPEASDDDKKRAQAVARMTSERGLESDDDRHRFISAFTEGASSSSYAITPEDMPTFRAALVRYSRGEVAIVDTDDGPRFVVQDAPSNEPEGML